MSKSYPTAHLLALKFQELRQARNDSEAIEEDLVMVSSIIVMSMVCDQALHLYVLLHCHS